MYKTKSFVIGAALLILALVPGLACGGKPAEAPPSPPPVTEPVPPVQETLPQLSEGEPPSPPETDIPANYATYTDESKLFSISYPSDWETALSITGVPEQKVKEDINNLKAGIPIEEASMIFVAGRRTTTGYEPNVNIVVEPMPSGITTHEQMVEAELRGIKLGVSDYRELSRVETSVDGRGATIMDFEGTPPGQDSKIHSMQMFTLVDKTAWIVTCTSFIDDFVEWEDDFNAIVRSLRISD